MVRRCHHEDIGVAASDDSLSPLTYVVLTFATTAIDNLDNPSLTMEGFPPRAKLRVAVVLVGCDAFTALQEIVDRCARGSLVLEGIGLLGARVCT